MKHCRASETEQQPASLPTSRILRLDERLLGIVDDALGAIAQQSSGLSQFDPTRMTDKECRADFALELEDLLAQRRLSNAETCRRFSEMKVISDSQKVS